MFWKQEIGRVSTPNNTVDHKVAGEIFFQINSRPEEVKALIREFPIRTRRLNDKAFNALPLGSQILYIDALRQELYANRHLAFYFRDVDNNYKLGGPSELLHILSMVIRTEVSESLIAIGQKVLNQVRHLNEYERLVSDVALKPGSRKKDHVVYEDSIHVLTDVLLGIKNGKRVTEQAAIDKARKKSTRWFFPEFLSEEKRRYAQTQVGYEFVQLSEFLTEARLIYGCIDDELETPLGRRLLSLHNEEILELAWQAIPEDYTLNRKAVETLLQQAGSSYEPEWPVERFLNKLAKHILRPYSDSEYKEKLVAYKKTAKEIAQRLMAEFGDKGLLSVSMAGSIVSENLFHPHESDLDILCFFSDGSRELVDQVAKFLDIEAERTGIDIDYGGVFGGIDGMIEGVHMMDASNVSSIRYDASQAYSPGSRLYGLFMHLASRFAQSELLECNDMNAYTMAIQPPLEAFYEEVVKPTKAESVGIFEQVNKSLNRG